jgi:hypothetical protein
MFQKLLQKPKNTFVAFLSLLHLSFKEVGGEVREEFYEFVAAGPVVVVEGQENSKEGRLPAHSLALGRVRG